MARGFPSMTALLGMLAVAGFQNRDKIAEMLRGGSSQGGSTLPDAGRMQDRPGSVEGSGSGASYGGHGGPQTGLQGGGLLGGMTAGSGMGGGLGALLGSLGATGVGGLLSRGLGELTDRFRETGRGDTAESWVSSGPNRPVETHELEHVLGPEMLEQLTSQTGLPREELLARLSRELPDAVDRYTPDGRMPDDDGQDDGQNDGQNDGYDAGASNAVTRADATGDEATPARTIENPLKGMAPSG